MLQDFQPGLNRVGKFHEDKITKRMLIFVKQMDYFMEEPILNGTMVKMFGCRREVGRSGKND